MKRTPRTFPSGLKIATDEYMDMSDDQLFDFVRQLLVQPLDKHWEPKKKDDKTGVHIYKRASVNPKIPLSVFKATYALPLDVQPSASLIDDPANRILWDPFVENFMVVKKGESGVVTFTTKPIGLVWGRCFFDKRIMRTLVDGSKLVACTSIIPEEVLKPEDIPSYQGKQRGWNYFTGVLITKTATGSAVQMVACSDAGGWLPTWMSEGGTPGALIQICGGQYEMALKRAKEDAERKLLKQKGTQPADK